jgi:predicted ATPase
MSQIAQALGVIDSEGADVHEVLARMLAERELLLVVDNFEQVLAAAPDVGRLLAAAPGLRLVVTSRAPLRLASEHELAVPPLAAEPSADLFLRRARALDPRLELQPGDEAAIAQIGTRLDGLPLAIELAAARTKVLSPAAILERLGHRLDLLSSGPRDAPARQQTLRAAIGWSYDLLDDPVKALFAQLGVFVGGWTLEAAEAVCGPQALDGIADLVDHSLVTRSPGRFGMLETVREYALERLEASGELEAMRHRHARAFAAVFAGGEQGMESPEVGRWLDRLDADRENVRAAIMFAVANGDASLALALCTDAWRYWERRGHLSEGRALLDAALALPDAPREVRLPALNGAGILAGEQGDFAASRAYFEENIAEAQALGDEARASRARGNLGNLFLYELDYERAIRNYEETRVSWTRAGNTRGVSLILQNLGIAHEGSGNHARAVELLDESIEIARRARDPAHLSSALRTQARILLADDDTAPALALLREGLALSRELSDRPGMVETLETMAGIAHRAGDARTGALLIGAAAGTRAAAGAIRQPDEELWVARLEAELGATLGAEAYAAAYAEGGRLTLVEATALAERLTPR